MMTLSKTLLIAACVLVAGCAHKEMTGEDHRAAAAADLEKSAQEKAKYDPEATAMAITPRSAALTDEPTPPPRFYNPSAAHLVEADRKMKSAFDHLEAARKLEKYEDVACNGISAAERMSCPLIAPHLEKVEEGSRGVVLHLKSPEKAKTLATQMSCHLAFSKANNFEQAPCPLYVKGVAITLVGDRAIEVTSRDPKVAAAVREEARKMFGEPNTVSSR
jgi:hypothetical protein